MDRHTAKAFMDLTVAMDGHIGEMLALAEAIPDEADKQHFTRAVGEVMRCIFFELIHPIETRFPDLNPDR